MDLSQHSREELIQEIRRLEKHVLQLRNVIAKKGDSRDKKIVRHKKKGREFDHSLYKKRKVLFQITYFGWNYHGFTTQEDSCMTIEAHLFKALLTTCLIQSRETSNYHRCGRTDKGVSAFRQVISIDVRTNLKEGIGVFDYPDCKADSRPDMPHEIDYIKIINSNLPPDIQLIAWTPAQNRELSARFDCKKRTYKYFFPLGSIKSLSKMNEAGAKLVGSHDFRNFCKMDVSNGVLTYIRRMVNVSTSVLEPSKEKESSPYDLCVLKVEGNAFLWHQIRCIVTVLFHIGQGREEPELIDELLDIEKNPCRPQYGLASEIPLNLFDCSYEGLTWDYNLESLRTCIKGFQELWAEHAIKAEMIKACLDELESHFDERVIEQASALLPHSKQRIYTPFLEMLKCPSLEEKIQRLNKRRKRNENSD
uniref:tRNA pseudouridine synthase 3 n=1 Tax=Lepeophtheirus salmonis TaxID=72036 RepID=D3PJK9_LEPSM|nr:tRNA pseudouridine synthase 3 [Lepeophtheirus salmonis]